MAPSYYCCVVCLQDENPLHRSAVLVEDQSWFGIVGKDPMAVKLRGTALQNLCRIRYQLFGCRSPNRSGKYGLLHCPVPNAGHFGGQSLKSLSGKQRSFAMGRLELGQQDQAAPMAAQSRNRIGQWDYLHED